MPQVETKFKRKKAVTLRTMKVEVEKPLFLEFLSPIESKKTIETTGPDKGKEKEIDVAHVLDLATGEECNIIPGIVLKKELIEHYPDNGYVSKKFEVTKKNVPGKRYKTYEIFEIESE